MKPMIDRDEKGRATHVRWDDGTEYWYDYDAAGHVTEWKDENGILHTN